MLLNAAVFIFTKLNPGCRGITFGVKVPQIGFVNLMLLSQNIYFFFIFKRQSELWSKLSLLFCHLVEKGLFLFWLLFPSLLWHFVANSSKIDCLKSWFLSVWYVPLWPIKWLLTQHLVGLTLQPLFPLSNFLYPYIMVPPYPNKCTPAVMESK